MNSSSRQEGGFTLVIALIMLLLITMMVSSSYSLSTTNIEGVGNQQWRAQALASADVALEQVVGSAFTSTPVAQSIDIDLNHDNARDYTVQVSQPSCLRATLATVAPPSSLLLPGISNSTWNTIWEMLATVDDPVTGAAVRVRTGVRVLLSDSRKSAVCP